MGGSKGYIEVAGILRYMKWDDVLDDQFELSDSAVGWGINLSSNIKFGSATRSACRRVFGEGIQNYMNDSPVDVGIVANPGNPRTPIRGETVPITGLLAFFDHNWNVGVEQLGRLLGASSTTTRTVRLPELVPERPLRARQPPVLAGAECHGGRGVPVGTPRELHGRLLERRHEDPVLVQVQLLREDRRIAGTRPRLGPDRFRVVVLAALALRVSELFDKTRTLVMTPVWVGSHPRARAFGLRTF